VLYTEVIFNAITQPNYPQQRLLLKVGMPVVLMRNLNQWMGLCNRTRLLITRLGDCVLEVTTSSSSGLNKHTFSLGLNKHIGTQEQ
jgi:ATP-dependent DNA helicase PIF1